MRKKLLYLAGTLAVIGLIGLIAVFIYVSQLTKDLPKIVSLKDYKPLMVSQVFDRNGKRIGEFFRERRVFVEYDDIPEHLINAFVAAEDSSFFKHGGVNLKAILRAVIKNAKAGKKVQGASTITQQVARSLVLTREKTYTRKIKEIVLASRMENSLSKKDILFLYFNQIYLGQGAYGVGAATEVYFHKDVKDITVQEAAILAGLPQAPSRYSPLKNPSAAKNRQRYVLRRMTEEKFISSDEAQEAVDAPVTIYSEQAFEDTAAYFVEVVRQVLVKEVGEDKLLNEGLKIYTGLDLEKSIKARDSLRARLRELDKRQGYRGPLKNLKKESEIDDFLNAAKEKAIDKIYSAKVLYNDGSLKNPFEIANEKAGNAKGGDSVADKQKEALDKALNKSPQPALPLYLKLGSLVEGVVTTVSDYNKYVAVKIPGGRGIINAESMSWARKPNPEISYKWAKISNPSRALKTGDAILVRIKSEALSSDKIKKSLAKVYSNKKNTGLTEDQFVAQYLQLELEQEPKVEGALLSIDQKTSDIIAMIGGYDFNRSKFNRTYQAKRQTGSAFKSIVYLSALNHGYTAASKLLDAPIVGSDSLLTVGPASKKRSWKPMNHNNEFSGDILLRNSLVKSLNIPTIKIAKDVGINWIMAYAKRLGVFSPINNDLSASLGSSGTTLYEITKVFAQINKYGKRVKPILVQKVENASGDIIAENISFDVHFKGAIEKAEAEALKIKFTKKNKLNEENPEEEAEEETSEEENLYVKKYKPKFKFNDSDQLISPATAFVTTDMLRGVITGGTATKAQELKRPAAGKTGTTNGYYDAWFVGYTPEITTGVWVGFDNEQSLGRSEVGGKSALPIWIDFMKYAHKGLPVSEFTPPPGVVYRRINSQTGMLSEGEGTIKQAFIAGSEPTLESQKAELMSSDGDKDFFKEEFE